ncbi:MAG: hypothetical protein NUV77_16855 [Thermoguttaceae bacterium]|jgi:hypothetical protein|nr:hypothetical protein [Thermoguttaceae bacterium]
MGRLVRGFWGLVLYFCLATVIAEAIMLVYAARTWQIDRTRLARMLAVARGQPTDSVPPPAPPPPPPEPVSYQQVLDARALRDKNLQLREQALVNALAQMRADQQKLADDEKRYKQQRAAYEKELADLSQGAVAAGRDEVRRILQSVKPKQAKEIVLQMLDAKETKEVVALLSGMTDAKRAKILGEFKTPEENQKIEEVLRLIRQGEPQATVAEKAKDQLKRPPGGT